jgi:hypothetical protein
MEDKNGYIKNSINVEKLSRLAKVANLELIGHFGQVGGTNMGCSKIIKTRAEP